MSGVSFLKKLLDGVAVKWKTLVVPYTDSNYSNFLSIWDRLLGTYTWLDRKDLIFGLDTHPDERQHSHIPTMLAEPFR